MMSSDNTRKAAILIVNGGDTAEANRWIRLCLERIAAYTDYPNYRIYVWNNRCGDRALEDWLLTQPSLTLLSAAGYETLNHPHRTPLQRLYHLARQEDAHYIVTMDNDAHPLRSGWLTDLLAALDDGAALAGVWRDEVGATTRPYLHPSCLCTTVAFIERHRLRFDFDPTRSLEKNDTLSYLTSVAEAEGVPIYRLQRSNRRNFHHLLGGVYGDTIYHHGAASQANTSVGIGASDRASKVAGDFRRRDRAAALLFGDYEHYIGWLCGEEVPPSLAKQMNELCQDVGNGADKRRRGPDSRAWKNLTRRRLGQILLHHPLFARLNRKRQRRGDLPPFLPLTAESLAPVPHGWTVKPPDFVGIGTPRSGTSWWYTLLLGHPQVVPHRVTRGGWAQDKELMYFISFHHRDMTSKEVDLYRQAFAAPAGAICGEFTTLYLAHPTCIKHLAAAAPETKIIVALRNPIDRLISHLNMRLDLNQKHMRDGRTERQPLVYGEFPFYPEATLHSLYSIGLEELFRNFDRDKVLILQYERSVLCPAEELTRTYRFLGVDDRYLPSGIAERVNSRAYAIPKPSSTERSRLAAYFQDDVRRVLALCPELDITLWPDFLPQAP